MKRLTWIDSFLLLGTVVWVFIPLQNLFMFPHSGTAPFLVAKPGTSYWLGPQLFSQPPSLRIFLTLTTYLLFSAILGTAALKKIYNIRLQNILMGLPIGYLLITPLNRIVTIACPNHLAIGVLGLIYMGAAVWACKNVEFRFNLKKSTALGGLVLFFLITKIQIREVHVIGDATSFFLNIFNSPQWWGSSDHIPLISQHYDEFLFLYPILFIAKSIGYQDPVFIYWLLIGFFSTSIFLICARLLNSFVVSTFFFFGQMFLIPYFWYLIFDSGNPLIVVLHPGRLLTCMAPLIAYFYSQRSPSKNKWEWPFLLALGLGLGCTVISNILCYGFFIFLIFVRAFEKKPNELFRNVFLALTLIIPAIATLNLWVNDLYGAKLILGYIAALVSLWIASYFSFVSFDLRRVGTVLGGHILALIFLGGSLIESFKFHWLPILHRTDIQLVKQPAIRLGSAKACSGDLLELCRFTSFAARFGFIIVLAAVSIFLLKKKKASREMLTQEQFLYFCVLGFFFSFFIYFFTNGAYTSWTEIWIKSRLLEPWFYGIIFCFILIYRNFAIEPKYKIAAICIYLLPNLYSLGFQLKENLVFFIRALAHPLQF